MLTPNTTIPLADLHLVSGGDLLSATPDHLTFARHEGQELVLRLDASQNGHAWTPQEFLLLDFEADQLSKVDTRIVFHDGNERLTLQYDMIPQHRVTMAVQCEALASQRFFLPTLPGSLKGHVTGRPTHIDRVSHIDIVFAKGRALKSVTIHGLRLASELPPLKVQGTPMVDPFGQWKDMDWPQKVHSEQQLVDYLKAEYDFARHNNSYPDGFSRFGGCLSRRFEPKGRFYKLHDGKRWWLVDPDGCAFFSSGICYASRMGVHGFVDGMEEMFDFLPPADDPVFRDAWTTADQIPEFVKRNGVEAGRGRRMFNFARANMIRAFGDNWWNAWVTINAARLKRWGFNTISVCVNNYFDERVEDYLKLAQIPFTWTLKQFPKTREFIFRDFPDVFSDEYRTLCATFAEQLRPFSDNPYLIGYFINNEPEWLFQRSTNPAARLLETVNGCESKRVLLDWLQQRFTSIQDFNDAFHTSLSAFDDLYRTPVPCADLPADGPAAQALDAFRALLLEQYVKVPTEALRAVCPQALNLGMRYASVTEKDFAGEALFDMFSSNNYTQDPAGLLNLVNRCATTPLIVGEWHYGPSDQGLLSNALVNATTQFERGKACANYLKKTMSNPQCVGVHYFELNDQPLLGRFDGECMPHGLIDICNHPHYDCVNQMAEVNRRMYDYCDGSLTPVYETWERSERF